MFNRQIINNLGSAEKLYRNNGSFLIPVLCTLNYYSFFLSYKYFATLWLHIASMIVIKKGAEHRNSCRNPQKISFKVQRTEINIARIFKHIVNFPCILNMFISPYSADYIDDICFSADPDLVVKSSVIVRTICTRTRQESKTRANRVTAL